MSDDTQAEERHEGPDEPPAPQPIIISTDSDRPGLSPVAKALLVGIGVLGCAMFLLLLAGRMRSDPAVVYVDQGGGAGLEGDQAGAVADPAWQNPLEAPSMPAPSAEARRMIGSEPGFAHLLYRPTSFDVWRQMLPPFAAPNTDLCAWRLTVDEMGRVVPTVDPDRGGVPLFEQSAPPCGDAPALGSTSTTSGSSTTSSLPASGPSR